MQNNQIYGHGLLRNPSWNTLKNFRSNPSLNSGISISSFLYTIHQLIHQLLTSQLLYRSNDQSLIDSSLFKSSARTGGKIDPWLERKVSPLSPGDTRQNVQTREKHWRGLDLVSQPVAGSMTVAKELLTEGKTSDKRKRLLTDWKQSDWQERLPKFETWCLLVYRLAEDYWLRLMLWPALADIVCI